jgi:hypothetical protein
LCGAIDLATRSLVVGYLIVPRSLSHFCAASELDAHEHRPFPRLYKKVIISMSSPSSVASDGPARARAVVDDASRTGATIHQKQRQGVQIYLEGAGSAKMGDINFNENRKS